MKKKFWKTLAAFALVAMAVSICKRRKAEEDDWE